MTNPAAASQPASTLGIIAGNGDLPSRIVAACRAERRPFFLLAFENVTSPQLLQEVPHRFMELGALGKAIDELRDADVRALVLAGSIARPKLSDLKLDG